MHNHITQHYDIPSHSFFFHSVRIFVLCIPFNEMLLLIISQTLNLIYYLLNSTILRFTTHCSTHAAFYFLSIWVLYIYFFLLNENKMCTSRNSKWCVCVCVQYKCHIYLTYLNIIYQIYKYIPCVFM